METITLFNKPVGHVRGLQFITQRRPEHFFRIFKGFGLSCAILSQLRRRGVREVIFIYTRVDGSQSVYACPLEAFYEGGHRWTDRQADAQLVVPVARMRSL